MEIQYGKKNKGMGVGRGGSEVTANDIITTNTSSKLYDNGRPGEENGGSEAAVTVLTTTDITDDTLQLKRLSTLRGRRPPDRVAKCGMHIRQTGAGARISATPGAASTTSPGRSTPLGMGALQSNSRDRQTITTGGIDPMPGAGWPSGSAA